MSIQERILRIRQAIQNIDDAQEVQEISTNSSWTNTGPWDKSDPQFSNWNNTWGNWDKQWNKLIEDWTKR